MNSVLPANRTFQAVDLSFGCDGQVNACAKSCISTIKNELVKRRTFVTRDQARLALFRYIESFYNPLRRHSSLAMLSPNDYEARYLKNNTAAAAGRLEKPWKTILILGACRERGVSR